VAGDGAAQQDLTKSTAAGVVPSTALVAVESTTTTTTTTPPLASVDASQPRTFSPCIVVSAHEWDAWTVCPHANGSADEELMPGAPFDVHNEFGSQEVVPGSRVSYSNCGEFRSLAALIDEVATTQMAINYRLNVEAQCALVDMAYALRPATTSHVAALDLGVPQWSLPISIPEEGFSVYGCQLPVATDGELTMGALHDQGWANAEILDDAVIYFHGCELPGEVGDPTAEYFGPHFWLHEAGRGDINADGIDDVIIAWGSSGGGSGRDFGAAWITRLTADGPLIVGHWPTDVAG
jgi:hypothetical protein